MLGAGAADAEEPNNPPPLCPVVEAAVAVGAGAGVAPKENAMTAFC